MFYCIDVMRGVGWGQAPTTAAVVQEGSSSSGGGFMSPSMFLVAISVCVFLFVSLLGGTYLYRRNKVVYHQGVSSGGGEEGGREGGPSEDDAQDTGVLYEDRWSQLEFNLHDRDRDRDKDRDSLRVSLDEGDDLDPRLFSALRSKKKTGLNIHEAKDNSLRNKRTDAASSSGSGSGSSAEKYRAGGSGAAPLPPPRRHVATADLDLSAFFNDVTYSDSDRDRDSDRDNSRHKKTISPPPATARVMPHPVRDSSSFVDPNPDPFPQQDSMGQGYEHTPIQHRKQ